MTIESQNPMIRAIAKHIAQGDKPVDFFGEEPGSPRGIVVLLEDGTFVHHGVNWRDEQQLLDWFVEAGKWLNQQLTQP